MSRLLDRLLILVCLLFVALMWQKTEDKRRDDPLNLAGFEERSKQFDREIHLEGTNRL